MNGHSMTALVFSPSFEEGKDALRLRRHVDDHFQLLLWVNRGTLTLTHILRTLKSDEMHMDEGLFFQ